MKYQSVVINSDNKDTNVILALVKNKLSIKDIKTINIKVIDNPIEKQSIGISEVSHLVEWAYQKNEDLRLTIINGAELLTEQAQNSMLKIIEEPPENFLIVLRTNNPASLLATINSRCLSINDTKLDDSEQISTKVEEFEKANYLERSRIIDRMFSEDLSRNNAAEFIEYLLKLKLKKRDTTNLLQIENVFRGVKRGVNLKLCFDYLNTLLK